MARQIRSTRSRGKGQGCLNDEDQGRRFDEEDFERLLRHCSGHAARPTRPMPDEREHLDVSS